MGSFVPDWPAPGNVRAFFTDRLDGYSHEPYSSLNLGMHVGDEVSLVRRNRASIEVPTSPFWLEQTHTSICIDADADAGNRLGDASYTRVTGRVLAIMVADCLPVLFTSTDGGLVAVAHAGWRGLADGILLATVKALGADSLLAWMGPAIGPCHYTVGEDVRVRFSSDTGFTELGDNKFSMNLYAIASEQLENAGVGVFGGGLCTYCEPSRFFSYRRDGVTGRMGGFIWLEPPA